MDLFFVITRYRTIASHYHTNVTAPTFSSHHQRHLHRITAELLLGCHRGDRIKERGMKDEGKCSVEGKCDRFFVSGNFPKFQNFRKNSSYHLEVEYISTMGRKLKEKTQLTCKVDPQTKEFLSHLAFTLGLAHNLNGVVVAAIGSLLDKIGSGEYTIVKTEVYDRLKRSSKENTEASHK